MLNETAELIHTADNSHAKMIEAAGWRANQPNETVRVFEAEWDGIGKFPMDSTLIRNVSECPERLKDKIRNHYKKLQAVRGSYSLSICNHSSDSLDEGVFQENRTFSVGFNSHLGYKFKTINGNIELCFFRTHPQLPDAWVNVTSGSDNPWSESKMVQYLASLIKSQRAIQPVEIVPFACCCLKCSKDQEQQSAVRDFFDWTGEAVSHGYWPECQEPELARLRAEMQTINT